MTLDSQGWSCWTPRPSRMLSAYWLPGRAQNSVRVLITDDKAAPWGFHDITLEDMAGAFYLQGGVEHITAAVARLPGVRDVEEIY